MSEGKEKFTPGPWVVKQSEWGISVQCEKSPSGLPFAVTPVCEIEQEPDTGGLEDAALIAAAPDMYAALDAILESIGEKTNYKGDCQCEDCEAMRKAAAALAKARGEAQMTDIEIKRKELETAKRIREMGSDGFVAVCDGIACDEDNCPFVVLCSDSKGSEVTPDYVRGFIATREAELAELDKATNTCKRCNGAGFYFIAGATPMESVKKTCECQTNRPTLDDFALALIQGGSYSMAFSSELAAEIIYERAATLKAESDRRRGI